MRAVSINLNKGLRTSHRFQKFLAWLGTIRPELLLAQEPVKIPPCDLEIPGYRPIGGNELTFAWSRHDQTIPVLQQPYPFCQFFDHAGYTWFNCYLHCDSRPRRGDQINKIHALVGRSSRPVVLMGDFNMSPNLEDGLYDGKFSTWSNRTDRIPLSKLLADFQISDLKPAPDRTEFTYEKPMQGKLGQFRCDLALASGNIESGLSIRYDHEVRKGPNAFTDHSAVMLEFVAPASDDSPCMIASPITTKAIFPAEQPLSQAVVQVFPHKTAIKRSAASTVARFVVESLVPGSKYQSVLDYGCGHGKDVEFYRQSGLEGHGWDPNEPFGFSAKPAGYFDLVVLAFILNVLPTREQRLQALKDAREFLQKTGVMLVVCRSPAAIKREASKGLWVVHGDGFLSDLRKGTFQKGLDRPMLLELADEVGLEQRHEPETHKGIPDAGWVLVGQK